MQHYQQSHHNHQSQPRLPPILPPPGSVPPDSGSGLGSGSGFVSGIEAAAASALTLANNIAFRPMTSQPAKCSKLKIRIFFDSTIFQAGGNLFGRMEVTATSSRSLKLGEIAIELAAYEEITSKEFTATQSFLSSRLCFQGTGIPPSNAVHGPCDEGGFWMAKKGKTTFPFAFQLPLDCPSSLVFGQTASLRYVVTGLVQVFYHGKDETILKSKEAFVVEAWDGYNPDYRLPVQASNSTKLFWGGSGALELEAMLSERLHSAGGNLTVEVKVKNCTSRKVQGIRIGVARRLEMVSDKTQAELNPGLKIETVSVSEVIGTQEFKSSSYLFDTGEERTMTVNMIVPGNARTIRGTALFEVTCFVVVSMLLGAFSGELSVEIPVKICHPASLTPAPKPKLDQNHLPHHYNIVDEDLDMDGDVPTRSNRRIGSNASMAPSTFGPDGHDQQEDSGGIGRQGEWNADERGLSPANSITSIKSLLTNPKQKLSKLADKIQRSTSPTSSGHIQHEHRKDSDNLSGAPSRRMAKSPPLGPAVPIAYVPAVERVRYTPFQPPPTTKAKEFLKAAAQYQQEMSGALAGLGGDDNVEFDLDDKAMATAIHQWISKKESEGRYQSQAPLRAPTATRPTPPIQIPATSPSRRRHPVEPINTQVGSFTSQISPGDASPQSYYSHASPEPSSPTAAGFSNQTTSRFIHHAHRQPAAPQTGAFGSAVEDCMTDPPLFARPLPLPSPPPTGSPKRPGLPNPPSQPRPISPSPVPIPIQTAESLALAREAYERVKRAGSPVPDPLQNATTPGSSAPRSGFVSPSHHHPSSFDSSRHQHPNIKVPIPVNSAVAEQSNVATSPSGHLRLLNEPAPGPQLTHHVKHGHDGHLIENSPPPTCSSPELRHIPLNRPLPVPGPKPQHLNQAQTQAQAQAQTQLPAQIPARKPVGSNPNIYTREAETRLRPEPAPRLPITATTTPIAGTATTTPSGHLRGPQPVMEEGATRSGHLYTPKPTPTLTARPPAPVMMTARVGQHAASTNKPPTVSGASATASAQAPTRAAAGHARKPVAPAGAVGKPQDPGSGFIYPKATRKPVAGTKPPTIAAKPKNLAAAAAAQQSSHSTNPPGPDHTTSRPVMDAAVHREFDQRLRRPPQEGTSASSSKGESLAPTASMRAPQMVSASSSSSSPSSEDVHRRSVSPRGDRRTHVTRGFQAPQDVILEEESGEVSKGRSAAARQQRGPTEGSRGAVGEDPRHRHNQQQQQRYHNHNHILPQESDQHHQQHRKEAQSTPDDENNHCGLSANQALDNNDSEVVQETPSEIRAHAIAAANSFRAKGANSGGYVVNTGKLRQAIRNTDSNNNSGGSSHLIQALADGAMSAASAAASGLGWGQQSSSPPSKPAPIAAPRPSAQQHRGRGRSGQSPERSSSPLAAQGRPTRPQQQRQQSSPKSRHLDRSAPGRSHHHHQNPVVEQAHDLTMRDIHFQTLAPGEYVVEQPTSLFDPLPEVAPILPTSTPTMPGTGSAVAPTSMVAAPTTETTTIPVTYSQQHREADQQTRSQHQVRVTQRTAVAATSESPVDPQQQRPVQSRSAPTSKVLDRSARNDPLPATPVAVAVEAHPDPTTKSTASASVIPPPRLDKTLPKIQEQQPASQSRILEHHPQRQQLPTETSRPSAAPGSATAAIFNSNIIYIPPITTTPLTPAQQQRARYYYGRAAESSAASGATALAATGPAAVGGGGAGIGGAKAINPKLQEYILKYNLAANTRS